MSSYKEAYDLMGEIWENFSNYDKEWFLEENPIMMHNTLGMHLRNHANLWKLSWEPELIDGVDHSENHPDAISSKVITDFQSAKRKEHNYHSKGE